MPRPSVHAFTIALVILVFGAPGRASVLRVNAASSSDTPDGASWANAFRDIAPALAAASSGDEIWVAEGTYAVALDLKPGVSLYGGFAAGAATREERDPRRNVTLLTAASDTDILTAGSSVERTTVVDGFHFRLVETNRSAIACTNASPIVRGNVFTDDLSYGRAAIMSNGGSPLVERNAFVAGSRAAIRSVGAITISANVFQGLSNQTSDGGAVTAQDGPIITGNIFRGNTNGLYGGALSGRGAGAISNNVFAGNTAGQRGGAISWDSSSSHDETWIADNTFIGNTAPEGGAIRLGRGNYRLNSNVIAFNTSGVVVAMEYNAATVTASYNCVFSNGGEDYSGIPDPTGMDGNLRADPRLAGVGWGDAHLQPDSPCIDAGDPAVQGPDGTDMDGQPRVREGRMDIGADESDGTAWPGTPPVVRVSASGNDDADGGSWPNAKRTVTAALEAIRLTGGEVWVAAGTYTERVRLFEYMSLYGGFAGTETARDARSGAASILDGAAGGSVVTIVGSGDRVALDGFTIRNGLARRGGGIFCTGFGAAPLIRGNVITGNSAPNPPGVIPEIGDGGGVYCGPYTAPHIVENDIAANGAYSGGGIYGSTSSLLCERNTIEANIATFGGGIYIGSSPATGYVGPTSFSRVANNVITNNWAGAQNACALGVNGPQHLDVVNNTFYNNSADAGGAAIALNDAEVDFANNIIAGSAAGVSWYADVTPTFRNNCVYANSGLDYRVYEDGFKNADQTGVNGNIRANPRVARLDRRGGDFHLTAASPCRDAGDSHAVQSGETDRDGGIRIQGLAVDIGAYEWPVPPPPGRDEAIPALWIAGGIHPLTLNPERLDTNADGQVDLLDALRIVRGAGAP